MSVARDGIRFMVSNDLSGQSIKRVLGISLKVGRQN